MIKKFVIIFFLFIPLVCFAKWIEVSRSEKEPNNIYFIDFATVVKKEGFLRFWTLVNYGVPIPDNPKSAYSDKSFEEVDCKEGRRRTMQSTFYSEYDGKGEAILIINNPVWRFVTPDSIFDGVLKAACAFKK